MPLWRPQLILDRLVRATENQESVLSGPTTAKQRSVSDFSSSAFPLGLDAALRRAVLHLAFTVPRLVRVGEALSNYSIILEI